MQVCEIPFQTSTMVITTTLGVSLKLSLPSLLHSLQHQVTDLCRTLCDDRARLLKRSDLVTGGALTTTDDGTSVTHSPTRRSCPTSDEGDNRLGVGRSLVVLLEVGSGLLLHGTTNFADEDDTFRTGVGKEDLDNVDVLGTGEGVTANTNGEGLTKTSESGLVNGLVSQAAVGGQFLGRGLGQADVYLRSGPRNDTNFTLAEDMAGHNTHLTAFADNPGTVTTNHPALALALQSVHNLDLVSLRDTFGDGDDELNLVLDGFNDGIGGEGRRNVNDRGIRLSFPNSVTNGAENGKTKMSLPGFL